MNEDISADCVGCSRPATKYCDGWNHSGQSNQFGSFSFSSQCGYPVCDNCTHTGRNQHSCTKPKKSRRKNKQ